MGYDNWQRSNLTPPTIKRKKIFNNKLTLTILILLIVFGFFFVVRPVYKIMVKGKTIMKSAKQLKSSFSKNDIELLDKDLKKFSGEYDNFRNDVKLLYWASFIPYVSDFKNSVEAGKYAVNAAEITVESIKPYAALIGFKKGGSSFIEKSSEDRLQTAILTLDKILNRYDEVADNLKKAEDKIMKINPNRYPKKFGKKIIRENVANYKNQVLGITTLLVDAKPLIKRLPEIFGKKEEKTYLILFQNDKERRATGGFLTSYAIFKIKNGKIKVDKTDDIYNLDASISSHPKAPKEILTFHKGVNQFYIRDSNLSPDLIKSIELFNTLYERSSLSIDYDGIITVDSKVLVDMLEIYGDTEAGGVLFSAREDKRCDCPQVLYTLFDIVDRPTYYIKENRKGILGQLMYALLQKALGFSPSKYWGTLAQTMYKNMERKHILLYFKDVDLQEASEKINFAGRIVDFDGDYLHVNNVNFAGAKSNMFVKETITSKTSKTIGGKIQREVVVEFKNPYPHSDCNLERGGLCLNATLRNWIRVYVPEGSKLVDFDGSEMKVNTYNDLNKTVFEGFLKVQPQGFAKATIKYTLPENIKSKNYSLMVQKQPGVNGQELNVQVGNKTVNKGIFDIDKVFKVDF